MGMIGTSGNDTLIGSIGNDTINGQQGADVIYGGTGNDTLYDYNNFVTKDYANDLLNGEAGNDYLSSNSGKDTLLGGSGDDYLESYSTSADINYGNVMMDGGAGDDMLKADYSRGDNTLIGGSGSDVLYAKYTFFSNNVLNGGDDNDFLDVSNAKYGNDTLDGGTGNDTLSALFSTSNNILNGGTGADLMVGGKASDTFYADDINDVVYDSGTSSAYKDTLYVSVDNYKTPNSGIEKVVYANGVKKLAYFVDDLLEGAPVGGAYGKSVSVSYSFSTSASGYTKFAQYTDDQKKAVRLALSRYSDIAGITFVEVADGTAGALRFFRDDLATTSVNDIGYFDPTLNELHVLNSADYVDMAAGTDGFQTLLHEIGHALGLKHPHEAPVLPKAEDTQYNTIMTYNDDPDVEPTQLGIFDLAAIHYEYGVNASARMGNQTYAFSDRYIWDGAGTDTFSASGQTAAVFMDLAPGSWSYVGAKANSILAAGQAFIGFGSAIENAIGGNANDTLIGNNLHNQLSGGLGDDLLYGGLGADTLNGGAGADNEQGQTGNDVINGDAGNDSLFGGTDNDLLNGGSQNDLLLGDSGNDTLNGDADNDSLYGGLGADALNGGLNDDLLFGESGNDTLSGNEGNDILNGGDGNNLLKGGVGNDTYVLNSSLASGFQNQRWETKTGAFWGAQKWTTGDFNGDGKTDLVNIFNDNGSMSADMHMSNGKAFQTQRGETKAGGFWDAQKWATGDFNGDGKTDLVNIFNDNGLMSADIHTSNGTGFQIQRGETKAGGFWDAQKWATGDFNGDGKTDLVNIFNDNGVMSADVHLSSGTGFKIQRWETAAGGFWDAQKWLSADVNGDGKADLINIFNDNGSTSVDVHLSTGTGFQIQRWETKAGGFWDAQQWSAADVDGDGKADLINAFNDNGLMSADVHISTGTGFQIQRWETKAGGFWDGQKWMAADITGDGKADLINAFDDAGFTSIDTHVAGDYSANPDNHVKSDAILEGTAEGIDTIQSNTNHTLEANVENLTLTNSATALIATGNVLNNKLIGNGMGNTLYGLAGNDTLQGNKGRDILQGGVGNDSYLFARGDGMDQILDTDSTSGNNDLLWFTQGVSYDQLWFKKVNNNLEVSIIGATDSVTINNWYSGSANHIETIKTSDNKTLSDSKIDNLVSAMAAFTIPAMGQTTLPSTYTSALAPVLAANWV